MELYPALDLRGGRSVRLLQGDFGRERVYGDPLDTAGQLLAAGARRLHVVDLDGARAGRAANTALVESIAALAAAAGATVQAGGGVRDQAGAEALLEAGVDRVVLGTAALDDPGFAGRLARLHPGRVVVGLDHRPRAALVGLDHRPRAAVVGLDHRPGGEVAVRGWAQGSGRLLGDVLATFEDSGVAAVVVTDIGRDGMLAGPDLSGLEAVLEACGLEVIASGGVASAGDLMALARLGRPGRRLSGAIVGMALREGRLSVEEAMAACAASG